MGYVHHDCFLSQCYCLLHESQLTLLSMSSQNICTFTPPGFKQSLNVKFPDSRLAVCDKCKKNFKTRDMCRVRNTHTDPPWTTAYVCITVDSSCTDNDGKYIDRPLTVRMVQWQPYAVRKPFDSKTPVCAACKRTNRTRSFCRERHKHRQLPWCTVYVVLSALDQADPLTVVAGASKPTTEYSAAEEQPPLPNGEIGYAVAQNDSNSDEAEYATKPSAAEPDSPTPASTETITSDAEDTGDDINDIAESRTFLIKVSSRGSSIHWLDLLEHDESGSGGGQSHQMVQPAAAAAAAVAFYNPADPTAYAAAISMVPHPQHAVDPNHAQYYAHYAHQHQNALKSQQQYFFQIQQRQQQQQMTQWQQQNAQYVQPVGGVQQHPGDVSATSGSGSTGGDAAGPPPAQQQQRDQGEDAATDPTAVPSPPPGQQWHMYYPPPVAYAQHTAATGEAIMNGGVGGAVFSNQQQHQHTNHHNDESQDHPQHDEQSEGAAEDEPDAKRVRSDVV
jgi:hypothetical protein